MGRIVALPMLSPFRCDANHPCTKKRTITREPTFLVFHKTGATPTTLSPILRLDKVLLTFFQMSLAFQMWKTRLEYSFYEFKLFKLIVIILQLKIDAYNVWNTRTVHL